MSLTRGPIAIRAQEGCAFRFGTSMYKCYILTRELKSPSHGPLPVNVNLLCVVYEKVVFDCSKSLIRSVLVF